MSKTIDYYFPMGSPWTYLGHAKFTEIAAQYGATVVTRPIDLLSIFPLTGGVPVKKRSVPRQDYRMAELRRWRDYRGVSLNLEPKHFPPQGHLANRAVIAAIAQGEHPAPLVLGFMHGLWAEERDIDDAATLRGIAQACGISNLDFVEAADNPDIVATYEANTKEALERGIFGAPAYLIGDELLWGQDRLEFVERILAE